MWRQEEDRRKREDEAQALADADKALPKGTRICVDAGRGKYVGHSWKMFGANEHKIRLDSGLLVTVTLKGQRFAVRKEEIEEMDPTARTSSVLRQQADP